MWSTWLMISKSTVLVVRVFFLDITLGNLRTVLVIDTILPLYNYNVIDGLAVRDIMIKISF